MTEEEMKKFVSELSLALAHIDVLTEELHKHVELVAAKCTSLIHVINN